MDITNFKEYGLIEKNNIPLVSSRIIAEKFSKRHDNVLRDIECALSDFTKIGNLNFEGTNFIKSTYKTDQNKKLPEYLLTRDGFSYIAMGFTGKKAAQFKIAYITAFNQMELFIKNIMEAKVDFPEFTDAIMEAHEYPKHYHFSNELDMINRIVLGMSTKQFKELRSLGNVPSIRPYMTNEQIQQVKTLQRMDIGLIVAIPDFQKRKEVLQNKFNKMKQKLIA